MTRSSRTARLAGAVAALAVAVGPVAAPAASAGEGGRVEVVARFDAQQGELPESFTRLADGTTYLTMGTRVVRLAPDGTRSVLATLPAPSPVTFALGIEQGPDGHLYVALGSFNPADAAAGVWRVTLDGVASELVHLDDTGFPNDLVFDDAGRAYVTDPFLGRVWRVGLDGSSEVWLQDDALRGDPPLGHLFLHEFGVDGIALDPQTDTLYLGNLDRGQVLRTRVQPDGRPGPLGVWVDDPRLDGADGLGFTRDRVLHVAVNGQDQLVAIAPDRTVTVTAALGDLDGPSAVEQGRTPHELYVTSFAISSHLKAPRGRYPLAPRPGLLRITR